MRCLNRVLACLCVDVSEAFVYIYVPASNVFPLCSTVTVSYLSMDGIPAGRGGRFSLWALLTLGQIVHHSAASLLTAGVWAPVREPGAPALPRQRSAALSQQRAPEGHGWRRGAARGRESTWAALWAVGCGLWASWRPPPPAQDAPQLQPNSSLG